MLFSARDADMTAKHTPTPWRLDGSMIGPHGEHIANIVGDGDFPTIFVEEICDLPEDVERHRANAAHIVRCVNAHDKLMEALRYAREYVSQERENLIQTACPIVNGVPSLSEMDPDCVGMFERDNEALAKIDAALALAEAKP